MAILLPLSIDLPSLWFKFNTVTIGRMGHQGGQFFHGIKVKDGNRTLARRQKEQVTLSSVPGDFIYFIWKLDLFVNLHAFRVNKGHQVILDHGGGYHRMYREVV